MELTPPTTSVRDRLRTLYLRLGLLGWLSLLSGLGALLLQHAQRLPRAYTWLEPLRTLRAISVSNHFPCAVLLVYGVGRYARRGEWDPKAAAGHLTRTLDPSALRALALRLAAWVFGVLLIYLFVLRASPDILDILALTLLALLAGNHRPGRRRLLAEAGYAICGTLIFGVVSYAYTVVKACALLGARRYDAAIVAFESALFGQAPHRVLAAWAARPPAVPALCDWVYFHFFEHMILVTVLLVALQKQLARTEYLAALALCYLIGGPLYHLFPAAGPSYFEPARFAFLSNPGLISGTVRGWLEVNTLAVARGSASELRTWGYIACMPSLHVAHELIMLYFSRGSRLAFAASLTFTLLTVLSVIVLGWHYPTDALGGALLAAVAIAIARWQRLALLPRGLMPLGDLELPEAKPVLRPFIESYLAERRRSASVKP